MTQPTKRNIQMTRNNCVVCDELLDSRLIPISTSESNTIHKNLVEVSLAINGAFCSHKCINKLKSTVKKICQ